MPLKPKPIRTHERAVELGRKGGKVKSEVKRIANIKTSLKNATEKTKRKWLEKLVSDPKEHAILIEKLALDINGMDLDENQKINLLRAWASVHKAIHPTSLKVQGEICGTFIVKWAEQDNNNTIPSAPAPTQIPQQPSANTPDAGGNKRGQDAGSGK